MKLYDGKTLPGLHPGQHQGAAQGGQPRGDGRHLAPLHPGQDLQRPGLGSRRGLREPVHGDERAGVGLRHHSLITNDEQRKNYGMLLGLVKQEYEDIVKNEVQRAISADEEAIAKLCANYIDNIKAYTQKEKVKNKYTGQDEEPTSADAVDRGEDRHPRVAQGRVPARDHELHRAPGGRGKKFDFRTNERLQKALS
jgi:serine protein kinase